MLELSDLQKKGMNTPVSVSRVNFEFSDFEFSASDDSNPLELSAGRKLGHVRMFVFSAGGQLGYFM